MICFLPSTSFKNLACDSRKEFRSLFVPSFFLWLIFGAKVSWTFWLLYILASISSKCFFFFSKVFFTFSPICFPVNFFLSFFALLISSNNNLATSWFSSTIWSLSNKAAAFISLTYSGFPSLFSNWNKDFPKSLDWGS